MVSHPYFNVQCDLSILMDYENNRDRLTDQPHFFLTSNVITECFLVVVINTRPNDPILSSLKDLGETQRSGAQCLSAPGANSEFGSDLLDLHPKLTRNLLISISCVSCHVKCNSLLLVNRLIEKVEDVWIPENNFFVLHLLTRKSHQPLHTSMQDENDDAVNR
ncbi:hypothetical protein RUM43_006495 [Polyplax serrata]|uniref:Uncharacterized protein n=1 Tax=Polyplax serrata TaxID=468196 RepID=A0AAN8PF26_POLSC